MSYGVLGYHQRVISKMVERASRTLGGHLTQWRKLRGLTAEQVAERAGISTSTLYRIEHGSASVSLESVLEVFRALGILDVVVGSADPLKSDVGRLRMSEELPERIRNSSNRRKT